MKFEKLDLDAFEKKKLLDNSIRSAYGGVRITTYRPGTVDVRLNDGETFFKGQDHTECDV